MIRKPPIRTYQRKNKLESNETCWQSSKLTVPTVPTLFPSNKIGAITEKENAELSLDDDPFDTTFDRLARNARLPIKPTYTDEKSWINSSTDVSKDDNLKNESLHFISMTLPKLEDELQDLLHNKKESKQTNVKKKLTKKKYSRHVKKKPLHENQNAAPDSMIKVEKRLPKFSKRKVKKKEEKKHTNSAISTSLISTSHNNNFDHDDNVENIPPNKDTVPFRIDIKPCSVILDNLNVDKLKIANKLTKNGRKSANNLQKAISKDVIPSLNISNADAEIECMSKKCFVKLEQLASVKDIKLNVDKRQQNMICSTPLNKCTKRPWDSLYVSPITINGNTLCDAFNDTNEAIKSQEAHKLEVCSNKIGQQPDFSHKSTHSTIELSSSTQPVLSDQTSVEPSKNENENVQVNYNQSDKFNRSSIGNEPVEKGSPPKILKLSVTSDKSCSLFDDSKINPMVSVNVTEVENTYDKSSRNLLMSAVSNRGKGNANDQSCSRLLFSDAENCSEVSSHEHYSVTDELVQSSQSGRNSVSMIETQKEDEIFVPEVDENKKDDSKEDTLITHSTESSEDNGTELQQILTRLQDPIRVTHRRNRYQRCTTGLQDIFEISKDENCDTEICETDNVNIDVGKELSSHTHHILDNSSKSVLEDSQSTYKEKLLYLKPGKSWMRSLSMLSNMQNGLNLEEASVGKGKKWSHSVKDILDMQRRGASQNYLPAADENEDNSCHDTISTDKFTKLVRKSGLSERYTNAGRISKRISVRVIPHNRTSKCIEDISFLEAYGIVTACGDESPVRATGQNLMCNTPIIDNIQSGKDDYAVNKDIVLQRCEQEDYLPFSQFFTDSFLQNCRKIGEGVYGEVFLHETEMEKSVIKIIPIEGDKLVNGEQQKKFGEILSEIVIAKELHNLNFNNTHKTNGFVEMKNVKCIIGKYPERLIELWKRYDEEKRSENDCPTMFDEDQLYIVLELAHGGQDLEAFVFHTAEEALALFNQTVMALAVAEEAMEFEHRDLHWGNILISRTNESYVDYKIEDREFRLPTKGVKVSIIDFTLSRMSYGSCCIYNDLALDPALFTAQGDYQFEIYRLMKDKVENTWHKFEPYTNILWLHYVLDKMITAARYKKKTLKVHKTAISKLKSLKNIILNYESSCDFITNYDVFTTV